MLVGSWVSLLPAQRSSASAGYFSPADAEFPRHRTRYVQRAGASSLTPRIPHTLPACRTVLKKEETNFDLPLLRARYPHGCISCVLR